MEYSLKFIKWIILGLIFIIAASLIKKRLSKNNKHITGVVQIGLGLGNALGARTANLNPALAVGVRSGVYVCLVTFGREIYNGVLFKGVNSHNKQECLEAHLLDFAGDLYGKQISIKIIKYLRPAKFFASDEAAKAQIKKDLEQARKVFETKK